MPAPLDTLDAKSVLLIRLSALGDVVNTLPLLPLVRERFPEARITYLTGSLTAPLIRADEFVDEVLVHDRGRSWAARVAFGLSLRRHGFDLLIDFSRARYSALLARLSGVPVRLGSRPGGWFGHANPASQERDAPIDRMRGPLDLLGLADRPVSPRFPALGRARADAQALLDRLGVEGPVLLSPGHSPPWPTKAWPVAHWAELARRLGDRFGGQSLLVGGPGDRPITRAIAEEAGEAVIDLAGETDLLTLGGLASLSRGLVGTDSGPLHIAAMAGAPVVGLYGPTDPVRNQAMARTQVLLHREIHCQPCFRKACPYAHECLDLLMPATVEAALLDCLERQGRD